VEHEMFTLLDAPYAAEADPRVDLACTIRESDNHSRCGAARGGVQPDFDGLHVGGA